MFLLWDVASTVRVTTCSPPPSSSTRSSRSWSERPRERALLVADLHLEKGSFFARHGQMIPPYDSRETLERVALAIRETGARRVITLGDNFHDSAGSTRLEEHAAGMLHALTRAVDWVWITGNHDPEMEARCGGTLAEELESAGDPAPPRKSAKPPGLSGHYHPRLQQGAPAHIRRPARWSVRTTARRQAAAG